MGRPGRALNTMRVHWAAGVLDPYLGCREGGTQRALVQRTLAAVIVHFWRWVHTLAVWNLVSRMRSAVSMTVSFETWKCWPASDRPFEPARDGGLNYCIIH